MVSSSRGFGEAVLVGHSMGEFVGVVAGRRHPDRFPRLVLVDGGIPSRIPTELPAEQIIELVLGPAARRLEMSFTSVEALRADTEDTLVADSVPRALEELTCPAILVRAPRGLMNEEPPLYPDDWLDEWRRELPWLRDVLVPDVNHYTIVISDHGAQAIAEVVRAELAEL